MTIDNDDDDDRMHSKHSNTPRTMTSDLLYTDSLFRESLISVDPEQLISLNQDPSTPLCWNVDDTADADTGVCSGLSHKALNTDENDVSSVPRIIKNGTISPGIGLQSESTGDKRVFFEMNTGTRICNIINLLGPAVHPSECAFRTISPFTRVPVRRNNYFQVQPFPSPVQAAGSSCSKHIDKTLGGVIEALESGRSRLELLDQPQETLFFSTMTIENLRDFQIFCHGHNHNLAETLESHIWTQHKCDLTVPRNFTRCLRQEADDLDIVQRHTFLQSSSSNTACNLIKSFKVRPSMSVNCGQRFVTERSITMSIKPAFSIEPLSSSQVIAEDGVSSLLNTVPFTKFLDCYDDALKDRKNNTERVLTLEKEQIFSTIRIDPDYDPPHQTLIIHQPILCDLLNRLAEINSASSVSALFRIPNRREEQHSILNRLSRFHPLRPVHRYEVITTILNDIRVSVANDQSMVSLIEIHEKRAFLNGTSILRRKMRLDADIEIPAFHDGDFCHKSCTAKKSAESIAKTDFFSRTKSLVNMSHTLNTGCSRSDRKRLHNRFVASSSGVIKVSVLENFASYIDEKKRACIFLQQKKFHDNIENEYTATARPKTAICEIIRSGSLASLETHSSSYPIHSWAEYEDTSKLGLKNVTNLDKKTLKEMRFQFCCNAKVRSLIDEFRILLLTGCFSRRNSASIFSYYGFLTNRIVDPVIFKRRYYATLYMHKLFNMLTHNQNHSKLSVDAPHSIQGMFFIRLIFDVLSNPSTQNKASKHHKLGCGTPYANLLCTQRHGQYHSSFDKTNNSRSSIRIIASNFDIEFRRIDEYGARLEDRYTSDLDNFFTFETLGKIYLNVRGELLHLAVKAEELLDRKNSFIAEINGRSRMICTPKNCAGYDNASTSPPCPLVHVSEIKKRKKEYKSRKKDRKRKRSDDHAHRERKLKKRTPPTDQKVPISMKSSASVTRIAIPSIPLGMTPISLGGAVQKKAFNLDRKTASVVDNAFNSRHSEQRNNSASNFSIVENSPDAVADFNSALTHQVYEKQYDRSEYNMKAHGRTDVVDTNSQDNDIGTVLRQKTEEKRAFDDEFKSFVDKKMCLSRSFAVSQDRTAWTLLTSESFLESYGEVVAELASGNWQQSLIGYDLATAQDSPRKIIVTDCPLLDVTGVDIELSNDSAIIVQRLSSWLEIPNNSTSVSIQQGSRAFTRRLVLLAASGRYNVVHVVLCLDVEMTPTLAVDIITLQNAVNQQSGCPAELITFEFVAPQLIAASIALKLISSSNFQESTELARCISDENVQERARFLITLVPAMTVHMAFRCQVFWSSCAESSDATQSLFLFASRTPRSVFQRKVERIISTKASKQFWLAINVDVCSFPSES